MTKQHILARLLLLLLLPVLLMAPIGCKKGSDAPLSSGLSMIQGEPVYDKDVAMRTDHFTVTPGMMAFFFYDYGGVLISEMEKHVTYDKTKSLHDQIYDDGLSWYDVLMNATLERVCEMLIYCEAAQSEGVTLTEAHKSAIEQDISGMRFDAAAGYSISLDEYLQALYGPLANETALRAVRELELLAATYSATLTKRLEQGITTDAAKAYAAANGLNDNTPSRNIAYLAIPYVGGKADDDKVSEVLSALQKSKNADTFNGFSAHGTVGAEQNLTPDNTGLAEISDWLFATERTLGDHGRVEIGSYTYVILYTANGYSYGEVEARMRLYDVAFADWYNGWVEALHFGYNYDIIDSYDI